MVAAVAERERAVAPNVWHADWVAAFGAAADVTASSGLQRRWYSNRSTLAVAGLAGSDVRVAEDERFVLLFSGVLTNIHELQRGSTDADAARVVLTLVKTRGREAFGGLRGPFAVVVWDRHENSLLVARDQIGMQPTFYARNGPNGWLISPSPDALVAHPAVSRDPDAVAISEWLCGWFPVPEDTAYRDVKRVRPGSVCAFSEDGLTSYRYWDPFPEGEPVQWLQEDELDAFDALFSRAVRRTLQDGSPAIFLSGGLDSIAVAEAASALARESGSRLPVALSLVFPDAISNEERIQKAVAERLGLQQKLLPFAVTVSSSGLLADALSMSGGWPQPMCNIWAPAYMSLARIAKQRGRQVLLTGRGGDEWLTVTPYILADQVMRGDFAGACRVLQMRRRSNNLSSLRQAARLAWMTACRPLASAVFDTLAPETWHRRRRLRLLAERPEWIAPDPAVRKAMDSRIDRWIEPARPGGGFYQREARTALRHPAVTHDMEETQEFGRRTGLRVLHPFWDVDLIELLYRVPPNLLIRDGRSKWLLRRRLSQRLGGLGLEQRGKVSASHVFQGIMEREAPTAWRRLSGLKALDRINVVRSANMESHSRQRGLLPAVGGAGRAWMLLNMETWVRRRA